MNVFWDWTLIAVCMLTVLTQLVAICVSVVMVTMEMEPIAVSFRDLLDIVLNITS